MLYNIFREIINLQIKEVLQLGATSIVHKICKAVIYLALVASVISLIILLVNRNETRDAIIAGAVLGGSLVLCFGSLFLLVICEMSENIQTIKKKMDDIQRSIQSDNNRNETKATHDSSEQNQRKTIDDFLDNVEIKCPYCGKCHEMNIASLDMISSTKCPYCGKKIEFTE